MLERFSDRARRVIVLAQEEARTLGHNYIGTEHLLLGLLREREGIAARVLESFDVTVKRVREQVERIAGRGSQEVIEGRVVPLTARATKVLELAHHESLSLGHDYTGTKHILLGLLRQNEGVAIQILLDLGAEIEQIRASTIAPVSKSRPHPVGAQVQESTRPSVNRETGPEYLRCSFCGKTQKEVERLIAGPGVYICNECVELCTQIIAEEREQAQGSNPAEPEPT